MAPAFPTADSELNRELARLLGILEADGENLLQAIARQWTADSSVEDDVHYLIVASLVSGVRAGRDCRGRSMPARVAQEAGCPRPVRESQLALSGGRSFRRTLPPRSRAGLRPARQRRFRPPRTFIVRRALSQRIAGPGDPQTMGPHCGPGGRAQLGVDLTCRTFADSRIAAYARIALVATGASRRDRLDASQEFHGGRSHKFIEALSSPQPAVVEKAARALLGGGAFCSASEMAAALRASSKPARSPSRQNRGRPCCACLSYGPKVRPTWMRRPTRSSPICRGTSFSSNITPRRPRS